MYASTVTWCSPTLHLGMAGKVTRNAWRALIPHPEMAGEATTNADLVRAGSYERTDEEEPDARHTAETVGVGDKKAR